MEEATEGGTVGGIHGGKGRLEEAAEEGMDGGSRGGKGQLEEAMEVAQPTVGGAQAMAGVGVGHRLARWQPECWPPNFYFIFYFY